MKEQITAIVTEMVANGYHLMNRTTDELVNWIMEYGDPLGFAMEMRDNFYKWKGI